jgi:hypothetical protein
VRSRCTARLALPQRCRHAVPAFRPVKATVTPLAIPGKRLIVRNRVHGGSIAGDALGHRRRQADKTPASGQAFPPLNHPEETACRLIRRRSADSGNCDQARLLLLIMRWCAAGAWCSPGRAQRAGEAVDARAARPAAGTAVCRACPAWIDPGRARRPIEPYSECAVVSSLGGAPRRRTPGRFQCSCSLRCPAVSGQGSNRIFAGKDGGSSDGEQEP